MTTLTVKPGQPIPDGSYPPRLIFATFWNGEATILLADHPEEDTDTLLREAQRLRRDGEARNKRLDSAKRKG